MTSGILSSTAPTGLLAWRHATIERPGCLVHYWLYGHPAGSLIVLCHAALTDHAFFARMVPSLAPSYRVLTWDIRGHGQSRPLQGPFTIVDAVEDVLAIIDSNDVQRAVMVGHGMGSFIAQEATLRKPDLVEALVVIGGRSIASNLPTTERPLPEAGGPMEVLRTRLSSVKRSR